MKPHAEVTGGHGGGVGCGEGHDAVGVVWSERGGRDLALPRVGAPIGMGDVVRRGGRRCQRSPRDLRTCTRATNRFLSIGVTTIPGGFPFAQGATSDAMSHRPISAERNSLHLRQNDGLSWIVTGPAPSSSSTTSSNPLKYRSRSSAENLIPYPPGSWVEPPLCHAVASMSPRYYSPSTLCGSESHQETRGADSHSHS